MDLDRLGQGTIDNGEPLSKRTVAGADRSTVTILQDTGFACNDTNTGHSGPRVDAKYGDCAQFNVTLGSAVARNLARQLRIGKNFLHVIEFI